MLVLAGGKRTAAFEKEQLTIWYAALGSFSAEAINRAVIEITLKADTKFPDLGDLYQACRRQLPASVRHNEYTAHGTGNEGRIPKKEVQAVAEKLGLEV